MIPESTLFEWRSRTGDFCEDFFGGFGPDKRFGVGIVVFEVVVNGSFEFGDRGEDAAADALLSDQAKEALDLIEPGARGGSEVQVKAGVLGQPCLNIGMLVGGVVVEDEVEIEFLGRLPVDGPQEAPELVMALRRVIRRPNVALEMLSRDFVGVITNTAPTPLIAVPGARKSCLSSSG